MLIVKAHGKVALNLDHVMNIEIPTYCKCDIVARVPSYYVSKEYENFNEMGNLQLFNPKFHILHLATLDSEENAKKVFADLIDAYERGAKVFRIPQ